MLKLCLCLIHTMDDQHTKVSKLESYTEAIYLYCCSDWPSCLAHLKTNLSLGWENCQHTVIDEFLRMVTGCALGTVVLHWMFKQTPPWFKVNKIPFSSIDWAT